MSRLLERGGKALDSTFVLQPAIVAASLGAASALAGAGVKPAFVAGHSLGEVAAFCAAGVFGADAAIDLAAERGRAMALCAARRPGGMICVHAPCEAALQPMLELGRREGELALAAHNAPDEWVLSGEPAALSAVTAAHGSERVPTHGAWHSSAMAGAVEEVRAAAHGRVLPPPHAPIVGNRDGRLLGAQDDFAALLAEQLTRPVRWAQTLSTLAAAGVTDLVTVGPGKVLRALARKNLGTAVRVHGTEDAADVKRTVEALR